MTVAASCRIHTIYRNHFIYENDFSSKKTTFRKSYFLVSYIDNAMAAWESLTQTVNQGVSEAVGRAGDQAAAQGLSPTFSDISGRVH